jgi:type IV secretion system protein VirD4
MSVSGLLARRFRPARRGRGAARWARPPDLRQLGVRRVTRGRLVIGWAGRRLVATESRHSVLVMGPTQSGKTTGLAIPAILEWDGPVVATSVKDDLAAHTIGWRRTIGPCAVFDPTMGSGLGGSCLARWSPVDGCTDWTSAQKMASWLVESTPGRRGMADAAFWYATAAKQLAPLLLAAHRGGMNTADVVRWTNRQEFDEPGHLLELSGDIEAAGALGACAERDERIRSSVATTLETVLSPFEDPLVAVATATTDIALADLLTGRGTLYLCGPSHEQYRVQGLFAAIVSSIIDTAVALAGARGAPLDPPLLLVLDEVANIAPVRDLDTLASTGAGLGIQLVTVCQDLAQLAGRYDADRARTIANNHRAKLLLSGVADIGTLDLMSGLAGEAQVREVSTSDDLRHGGRTRSTSTAIRRLAPTDQLRRIPPGEGVLVYGHLPPARIRLRRWYGDRRLRARAGAEP